jgi:tetratricopeptide (TPR) repeat protein
MENNQVQDLIDKYTSTTDKKKKASIGCDMCSFISGTGNQELAREYANEVIEIAKEIGDHDSHIRILNIFGNTYAMQGQFALAGQYFNEALVIAEENQHTYYLAFINHNLAKIEGIKQNQPKALEYATKAAEYCKMNDNTKFLAEIYLMISGLHVTLNKFDIALEYLKKSDENCQISSQKARIYYQYARIYQAQEDYKKALDYAKRAYKVAKQVKAFLEIVESAAMVAGTYLLKKQYKQGKEYAVEALTIAEEHGLFDHYTFILLMLAETCIVLWVILINTRKWSIWLSLARLEKGMKN